MSITKLKYNNIFYKLKYFEYCKMNKIKDLLNSDNIQQALLYLTIAAIILISIYIFFSFYIEIFLTLIFVTLVLILKKIK